MRGIINGLFISIHAPHAGRDARCKSNTHRINISIHAPHAGRDDILCLFFLVATNISIHAPHAGRDSRGMDLKSRLEYFNPRAPCGARRINVKIVDELILFQSTRPMRGATDAALRRRYLHDISIHAPHAGRDAVFATADLTNEQFQSTRPMRGATWSCASCREYPSRFQSTRPMRGATAKVYKITLHTFATKGNSWTISRKTLPFKAFCRLQIGKNFSICGANRCGNFCELLLRTIRSSVLPEGRSACSQNAQFYSHTFSRDNRNADCLFPDP